MYYTIEKEYFPSGLKRYYIRVVPEYNANSIRNSNREVHKYIDLSPICHEDENDNLLCNNSN